MPHTPKIPAIDIFGIDPELERPCDCATEFGDAPERTARLIALTTEGGRRYVTDRYVMIRADLVDAPDAEEAELPMPEQDIPDTEPPVTTEPLQARYVHLLDAAGFDLRQGPGGDHAKKQHVYRDGEHVGSIAGLRDPSEAGITLDELPAVRALVAKIEGSELDAHIIGNLHNAAAAILHLTTDGTPKRPRPQHDATKKDNRKAAAA